MGINKVQEKVPWGTTTHLLKWLKLKTLTISNVGEGKCEWNQLSYIAYKTENCYK